LQGSVIVNRAAVADLDDEYHEIAIFQPTDDPVVAHSITPKTKLIPPQWLTEIARILRYRDPMIQIVDDFLPGPSVELPEISQHLRVVFNRPGQVLSAPVRW
jgi:hypothetical protein